MSRANRVEFWETRVANRSGKPMSLSYVNSGVPIESLDVPGLGLATKGLEVKHPLFGDGVITVLLRFRDGKHAIGVEFRAHGYKLLAPEYAKLRLP